MNVLQVATLINALLATAANSILAVQRFSFVVERARAEGRDISDDELAAIKAESDKLTEEAMAALNAVEDAVDNSRS